MPEGMETAQAEALSRILAQMATKDDLRVLEERFDGKFKAFGAQMPALQTDRMPPFPPLIDRVAVDVYENRRDMAHGVDESSASRGPARYTFTECTHVPHMNQNRHMTMLERPGLSAVRVRDPVEITEANLGAVGAALRNLPEQITQSIE